MRFPIAIAAILVATPAIAQSTKDTTKVTVQPGQGGTFTVQGGPGGGGGTMQIQIQGGGISLGQGGGTTITMGSSDDNASNASSGLALNTPASLGMSLSATGTKGDTLGLFVESVVPHGPAARAGIAEGDRIISIDTVDLWLAGLSATDPSLHEKVVDRLRNVMTNAKAGTPLHVKISANGKVRTVTVTPDKWGTVYTTPDATERKYTPVAIM